MQRVAYEDCQPYQLTKSFLDAPERYYPLRLLVCDRCWLVQTEDYASAALQYLQAAQDAAAKTLARL